MVYLKSLVFLCFVFDVFVFFSLISLIHGVLLIVGWEFPFSLELPWAWVAVAHQKNRRNQTESNMVKPESMRKRQVHT